MIENLETLEPAAVPGRVHELADAGYRFVTITCCTNEDGSYDLFYSFDKDYFLLTLKITLPQGEAVESISATYLAAVFAENEISELFGVTINNKAIDYGGHFLLSEGAPDQPFGPGVVVVKKEGGKNA